MLYGETISEKLAAEAYQLSETLAAKSATLSFSDMKKLAAISDSETFISENEIL